MQEWGEDSTEVNPLDELLLNLVENNTTAQTTTPPTLISVTPNNMGADNTSNSNEISRSKSHLKEESPKARAANNIDVVLPSEDGRRRGGGVT